MAELITGRLQPRVDLTPMVDLAFLLITFFMLTTSLNKPQAMDVTMPDTSDPTQLTPFSDRRTMTVLLGANNKIVWYWGRLDQPIEGPRVTTHGGLGIRSEILDKKNKIAKEQIDAAKGLMIIIHPSNQSHYSDLVSILDEMKINNVKQYMMGEISEDEIRLLQEKKAY
ncbi:MAG TPA: biopolymer transporter ExbD [Pseudosphingobacterium sp.]|nr:biopolymer transporter ExbD [Pseudosphingobacterium sp.]